MKYTMSEKILKERVKFRIYCSCGHSMIIFPFEHKNKKLCTHCGKYVYKKKIYLLKRKISLTSSALSHSIEMLQDMQFSKDYSKLHTIVLMLIATTKEGIAQDEEI